MLNLLVVSASSQFHRVLACKLSTGLVLAVGRFERRIHRLLLLVRALVRCLLSRSSHDVLAKVKGGN